MSIVIGLSGKARHGKDTVVKIAERHLGANRVSRLAFADAVRDEARADGWNGVKDEAGRTLLQRIGMERRAQDPEYWIKKVLARIDSDHHDVVFVTDVRFENEADTIQNQLSNSELWRIIRLNADGSPFDNGLTEVQRAHPSETELDDHIYFDARLEARDLMELECRVLYELLRIRDVGLH